MRVSRQFLSFVLAGGFAAAVNVGSRMLFSYAMPYEVAIVPAYLCGMATAFLLNRAFVFKEAASGGDATHQALRFALVNLVALAQVWLVGVGLVRGLFPVVGFSWHAEAIGHAIGVASPIATSYFAHKHFSFSAVNDRVAQVLLERE